MYLPTNRYMYNVHNVHVHIIHNTDMYCRYDKKYTYKQVQIHVHVLVMLLFVGLKGI